jgi:hypothetical protein
MPALYERAPLLVFSGDLCVVAQTEYMDALRGTMTLQYVVISLYIKLHLFVTIERAMGIASSMFQYKI